MFKPLFLFLLYVITENILGETVTSDVRQNLRLPTTPDTAVSQTESTNRSRSLVGAPVSKKGTESYEGDSLSSQTESVSDDEAEPDNDDDNDSTSAEETTVKSQVSPDLTRMTLENELKLSMEIQKDSIKQLNGLLTRLARQVAEQQKTVKEEMAAGESSQNPDEIQLAIEYPKPPEETKSTANTGNAELPEEKEKNKKTDEERLTPLYIVAPKSFLDINKIYSEALEQAERVGSTANQVKLLEENIDNSPAESIRKLTQQLMRARQEKAFFESDEDALKILHENEEGNVFKRAGSKLKRKIKSWFK